MPALCSLSFLRVVVHIRYAAGGKLAFVNATQSLHVLVVPKNRKRARNRPMKENEQRRNTSNAGQGLPARSPRFWRWTYSVSAPPAHFFSLLISFLGLKLRSLRQTEIDKDVSLFISFGLRLGA